MKRQQNRDMQKLHSGTGTLDKKVAEQGDIEAKNNLGTCYMYGSGEKDEQRHAKA